ncbi:MAG: phospho-N-acetylmuramoyl-pentapeptide-transferase [Clostridia bacterium]|nr:phospho-N-acetylmuramoyl-pentapeptide-transferase [Clostridia bacterium]
MKKLLLVMIFSFAVSMAVGFVLLPLLKKLKAKQPLLHYVKEHGAKSGTPTMGGLMFLIAITLAYFVFAKPEGSALIALSIMLGYGAVGFLDDYIKIASGKNQGLRAYQKILFQLAIALIAAFYAQSLSLSYVIPFWGKSVYINGAFGILFAVLVFLATTNGVNFTDGLDGLATKVSIAYLALFSVLTLLDLRNAYYKGDTFTLFEGGNTALLLFSAIGACFAFLLFNTFPAKIFMGDTGSLALGGLIASTAIFSRYTLFLPLFGIMFAVSCLSVILQVASYKLRNKKRIFLMAPLHHDLQQRGIHENRITLIYLAVTLIVGLLTITFTFL